jgi:hypothetical protein
MRLLMQTPNQHAPEHIILRLYISQALPFTMQPWHLPLLVLSGYWTAQ